MQGDVRSFSSQNATSQQILGLLPLAFTADSTSWEALVHRNPPVLNLLCQVFFDTQRRIPLYSCHLKATSCHPISKSMRKPGSLSMHRPVIAPRWMVMLTLFASSSALADDGYRFFYHFVPGTRFVEQQQTRQESGGKLISQFDRTIEYQVSQAPGSRTPILTARIVSLSNKGRRIEYYEGVTFQANISVKGEISGYSFSGGQPRYRALIQAAGPANRSNIFWMPRLPDTPMNIGDSFSQLVSTANPGMEASAKVIYELMSVQGPLAEFKLQRTGSLASESVGGTEISKGRAVFDMEKGMWSSIEEQGEGTAKLPGVLSNTYKQSTHKQIASAPCRYIIHAGTPSARHCTSGQCGMVVSIPYVRISTEGSCPPLEGQYMTEAVHPEAPRPGDSPCPVGTRIEGRGCRIGQNGYLSGCVDTFSLCGGHGAFPPGTCSDRIRQQYFIGPETGSGRRLIAVNYLEFRITRGTTSLSTEGELVHEESCLPEFHPEFDRRIRFPSSSATSP
jgi:hypothetical protein